MYNMLYNVIGIDPKTAQWSLWVFVLYISREFARNSPTRRCRAQLPSDSFFFFFTNHSPTKTRLVSVYGFFDSNINDLTGGKKLRKVLSRTLTMFKRCNNEELLPLCFTEKHLKPRRPWSLFEVFRPTTVWKRFVLSICIRVESAVRSYGRFTLILQFPLNFSRL